MKSGDAIKSEFVSGFDGQLLLPDHEKWNEALFARVFNGRRPGAERRPDAILVAGSVEDVQRGVRLANEQNWEVEVRSGGHSIPVWSVRHGGLLIDLGQLNKMSYDEATHVVTAGPAVIGGRDLYPFLKERGRFFNGGHHPTVGLGGFLLQGGHGWAQRAWGWGAESVVAVDVVTATGDLVRADEQQHSDLFWAARGAGAGFPGIVVNFHIETRPMFGYLGHTVQIYEMQQYADVMRWVYGLHEHIDASIELVVQSFVDAGESDENTENTENNESNDASAESAETGFGPVRRVLLSALSFAENREHAERALAPFQHSPVRSKAVVVQHCQPSSLEGHYEMQDLENPPGSHYISDNIWVDDRGDIDGTVAALGPLFGGPVGTQSWTIWISTASDREVPDMAFSPLSDALVNAYIVYDEPGDYDAHRAWLDEAIVSAEPVIVGQYIGEADQQHRQRRFLEDDHWQRLQAIIEKWDSQGRFASYLCKSPATLNRDEG